jgi:hypothetical protein
MPNCLKSSQNSCQAKNRQNIVRKLYLIAQNIHIELLLKPKNTCNKPYLKNTYLGKNVTQLLAKCSPKCCHWATLPLQQITMNFQK